MGSYLLGLLANEGYLIISVPYNVTFDHEKVTREIFDRFHACFDSILKDGLPLYGISAAQIADLPFYSVGHRSFNHFFISSCSRFWVWLLVLLCLLLGTFPFMQVNMHVHLLYLLLHE